jgi:alpha-L-fucosidase 2
MNDKFQFVKFILICSGIVSAATQSFDPAKGMLDVDYRSYLSKHHIVYNEPITDSVKGLTIGNGRVGAIIYNKNGITAQVTGVDASEQTCFSAGLLNLSTTPSLDANYTKMQQYLSLYDGKVIINYDTNRTVTFFGAPNSELLGIHVKDSRTVNTVTFKVSFWPSSTVGTSTGNMAIDVPDMNTWKTYTSYANENSAGISRGQTDANNFGLTLAASVEGTNYTTKVVDNGTVQLQITPATEYTIWIACASRLNAPGHNSVTYAQTLLDSIKQIGYTSTLKAYTKWWNTFWEKSFVQYSNTTKDADYCENFYYLSNYLIASGAFGNYPFHHINGVYRWSWDIGIHWSVGYWYWNQRDLYNSFLASNRPDVMSSLYRLYFRNLAYFKSYGKSKFNVDGAMIPETMRWDGDARQLSDFTDLIFTTGTEVAYNMYMRFRYTNDSIFLKDTAYPVMKEAAKFLSAKLTNSNGQYIMANSNCHETYWDVKNALTDLAAVRCLFPRAIEVSKALNVDSDLSLDWQSKLDKLTPIGTENYGNGKRFLAYDNGPATTQNAHNVENIACELQWPYDITGIGKSDYETAVNSYNSRPYKYNEPWSQCAIYAARIGLGDSAFTGMKYMLSKYQTYPNGLTNNTNGVFEYEGSHMIAMNESFLQSHFDTIRVFPATPSGTSFTGKFTLLAKGGFLVSSEKENGEIKYVGFKSLFGEQLTIYNPWGTETVQVRSMSDNKIIAASSNSVISFGTGKNEVYVLERTAAPFSGYTSTQITSTANGSAKSMSYSGKTVTLGVGQGDPPYETATLADPVLKKLHFTPVTVIKSKNTLRINFTAQENGTVSLNICNLKGEVVKNELVTAKIGDLYSCDFDISGIAAGSYIVKLTRGTLASFVSKVIFTK